MLRNKKLQKGSTLPLLQANSPVNRQLADYIDFHIVSFYLPHEPCSLLKFKSKKATPFIIVHEESKSSKLSSAKPPMLKLALKSYEEVTYEQIADEQDKGVIQFGIRPTTRHELKK